MTIFFASPTGTEGSINKTITNITQANPAVVTSNAHGYSNNDIIFIYGVTGMTQINGKVYTVANVALNTFELQGVDSTGYTAYSAGGTARKPYLLVNSAITAASSGDEIRIERTTSASNITGANCTWTDNSNIVRTSASLVGSIVTGDYIGRPTATGNGSTETFYRVTSVGASFITLDCNYYGTTGTDTNSIYLVIPTSAMSATAATAIAVNKTNLTISGGWNFSTNAQTGETWIKSTSRALYAIANVSSSGCTLSKLNLVEASSSIIISVPTNLTNITCLGHASYGTIAFASCVFTNCVFAGGTAAQGCLYVSSNTNNSGSFSNCLAIGLTGGSGNGINAIVSINMSGLTVVNCGGINGGGNNNSYYGATVINCVYGITSFGNGCYVYGNTFTNCTYGVNSATASKGTYVYNNTFTNCTYGVYINQAADTYVENNTFTQCIYDCFTSTSLCSDSTFINNRHVCPLRYAYFSASSNSGTIRIVGDTIDDDCKEKALYFYNINVRAFPQYILHNAFGKSGLVWGVNNTLIDTTKITSTGNYSLQLSGTYTAVTPPFKIATQYVQDATEVTFNYKLQAKTTFTGTITPYIKLNGVIVKTGAAITSVSVGSWDSQTITVPSGDVDYDGELSLELGIVANNNLIWVDTGSSLQISREAFFSTIYQLQTIADTQMVSGSPFPVTGTFTTPSLQGSIWRGYVS